MSERAAIAETYNPLEGLEYELNYEGDEEVIREDGPNSVRFLIDPLDSAPRNPLYAEVLNKETGDVRTLQQISSYRADGKAVHLFIDNRDPADLGEGEQRTNIALIDNAEDLFRLFGVPAEKAQVAFLSPVAYLDNLEN